MSDIENRHSAPETAKSRESAGEAVKEETKATLERFSNHPDAEIARAAESLLAKIDSLPSGSNVLKLANEQLWAMEGGNARVDRQKFAAFADFLAGNLN